MVETTEKKLFCKHLIFSFKLEDFKRIVFKKLNAVFTLLVKQRVFCPLYALTGFSKNERIQFPGMFWVFSPLNNGLLKIELQLLHLETKAVTSETKIQMLQVPS